MSEKLTEREAYVLRLMRREAPAYARFVSESNQRALVRLAYRGLATIENDDRNPRCLRGRLTEKGRSSVVLPDNIAKDAPHGQ